VIDMRFDVMVRCGRRRHRTMVQRHTGDRSHHRQEDHANARHESRVPDHDPKLLADAAVPAIVTDGDFLFRWSVLP
jgi:hypothetical protein